MKKLIIVFFILIIVSCSEEQRKLEIFSPEAFAFQMENGWELNASFNVKGFQQREIDGEFTHSLTYLIDFISPNADTIKEADFGQIDGKNNDELSDIPVDLQIEMNSNFTPGKYTMIIKVNDLYSLKSAQSEQFFELEKL